MMGAKPARILRTEVHVVRRLLVEVVVGRMVRKGASQHCRITHERTAGLERRVEPFVRIERERIR